MDNLDPEGCVDSYEASKDPVVVTSIALNVRLFVADPEMV